MMNTLLQWLGWAEQPSQELSSVDLFLAGHSIPAISASAGQQMIAQQRQIEAEIRNYILSLEAEIARLRAQIDA